MRVQLWLNNFWANLAASSLGGAGGGLGPGGGGGGFGGGRSFAVNSQVMSFIVSSLGADVKVILTPPCMFCKENH